MVGLGQRKLKNLLLEQTRSRVTPYQLQSCGYVHHGRNLQSSGKESYTLLLCYMHICVVVSTCSKHTILHRKRKFSLFVATLLNCFWPWPYVFTDLWGNGVLGCFNAPRNFRWTPKAILLYRLLRRTVIFLFHFCISACQRTSSTICLKVRTDCFVLVLLFPFIIFFNYYYYYYFFFFFFFFFFLLFSTPVKTNSPMLSCIGVISSIIHLK